MVIKDCWISVSAQHTDHMQLTPSKRLVAWRGLHIPHSSGDASPCLHPTQNLNPTIIPNIRILFSGLEGACNGDSRKAIIRSLFLGEPNLTNKQHQPVQPHRPNTTNQTLKPDEGPADVRTTARDTLDP